MAAIPNATPAAASLDEVIHHLNTLSRRGLLRSAGALLAGAGVGALGTTAARAALPPGVKHLTEAEAAVFARVAEVTLPVVGTRLRPWAPEEILTTLDAALLAGMAPHLLAGLKGGVAYFNDGPRGRFGKPFTALEDGPARLFLDAWGASAEPPQRGLAMGLKKLVQLSYWANPASWAPLGYDGPMTPRVQLTRLGNAPLPRA
ncbi:hypothetical protein [Ideonella livida]|uniref:Gluconate 2-dehydrogenase subunit 3 family protein n=1 Tax=Ideonella livida TaxID=2707176 RepID=A0A7C9TKA7_9BURK|nr:hypothetical protein [Ideonella livida]NDY92679.1 hypothetical protein [Ideonella livida]